MGPMLRRTRNAVNSLRKTHLTVRKKAAVSTCNEDMKSVCTVKMKTLPSSESRECCLKGKELRSGKTVLGDSTNKSGTASNLMALRARKNVTYDSGLDSSSSTTSADLSCNPKVICSPRSNKLNKKGYSMKNMDVYQTPVIKNSIVLLENIDELLEKISQTSPEPSSRQKTCVYKNIQNTTNENLKTVGDMLPEEKLALYEFEVDENEPMRVKKKKRKRQRRIKMPPTTDSDYSPLASVVKQMCHLTTKTTDRDRNIASTSLSSLSVCKRNKGPKDSQMLKQTSSKDNVSNEPNLCQKNTNLGTPHSVKISSPISPIEKSGPQQIVYSPKTVRFANNNYAPSANSTPNSPVPFRKTDQISASPNLGTPRFNLKTPRNRGVSSLYIRPNSNVHHKFVLDDSVCSENEEPTLVSPKTPPNIPEPPPARRQERSRQTSIQHFFNTSMANLSSNSTKTNLDASGLFDEPSNFAPDQLPGSSKNLSLSFPSFVTTRKKYRANYSNNSSSSSTFSDVQRDSLQSRGNSNMTFDDRVTVRKKYTYVPRISSFEPRDSPRKSGKELVLENCFGFDDDNDSEDETTLPLKTDPSVTDFKNNTMPASSTPYGSNIQPTQARPARISVQELRQILAPIVAKRPVHPRPILQAPNQSLTPTSVHRPSSVSYKSRPTSPKSPPVSQSQVPSQSTSTPQTLLFTESKVLTPVSFADDTASEYFSKPARKSYSRSTRTKRFHYYEDSEDEHEPPQKIPKKKKRDVKTKSAQLDLWAADINSHFDEIEYMELCVE